MTFPWLTALAVLPALGAVFVMLSGQRLAKQVALAVSVITFVLAVIIAVQFRPGGGMQFAEQVSWIKPLGAYYALGLDGIGLTLVLLVVIVTPVVIIASWRDFELPEETRRAGRRDGRQRFGRLRARGHRLGGRCHRVRTRCDRLAAGSAGAGHAPEQVPPKFGSSVFFALVLAVESSALFLFLATDVFLFYVFFEVILIPMYFLIGGFGPGPRRTYAAAKFLIFGLLGGFVMLASVIGLYVQSAKVGEASYLLSTLSQLDYATNTERWLFLGFMFAFAIKAPLVPLHTWLPDAAEESSPAAPP